MSVRTSEVKLLNRASIRQKGVVPSSGVIRQSRSRDPFWAETGRKVAEVLDLARPTRFSFVWDSEEQVVDSLAVAGGWSERNEMCNGAAARREDRRTREEGEKKKRRDTYWLALRERLRFIALGLLSPTNNNLFLSSTGKQNDPGRRKESDLGTVDQSVIRKGGQGGQDGLETCWN